MERPLTEREGEVLDVMLAALPSAGALLNTDELKVIDRCQCGCPTIIFDNAPLGRDLVSAAVEDTGDLIILFGWEEGPITSLEYASVSDETPAEFPSSSSLRLHPFGGPAS